MTLTLTTLSCSPAIDFQPHDSRYEICGQRASATPPRDDRLTVVGTIHRIVDETPVDGPVAIVVIDPAGAPKKLYFGSLFTQPGPSEQRTSVYRAIAPSREGDCVRARGTAMPSGALWIDEFVNLDHAPAVSR